MTYPLESSSQTNTKHYISWDDFHKDALALAQKLPPLPWKGMVAITRGGLIPAGIISRALNITLIETVCLSSYDDVTDTQTDLTVLKNLPLQSGENWLVIDDLIDTGATVQIVRKMLPGAHFASLYGKEHGKHLIDTFVREINAWIVFPWEMTPDELQNLGRP
ncbi:MAG: xanthine phosphoribosyltransferase [Alphaproteobacteria bacterium 16-39-46]|nr:MAG: xanthine phosphoribosyltransferase [Alphaproteobacteria bacterium 16-39-46]OZA43074.1 MAG: xanthine phosphoribosyltransferase [Alphaproteobacteria bacterium 17-39-52]HQS84116.1 xanthine phosphoribosyltransferase [Alphaproteobacteria bacterium]HQS93990.1 xanthine phosphoribosyltransferase [Alphaproteobacteria bacterium]